MNDENMNDENKENLSGLPEQEKKPAGKVYFIVGVIACVLGAVAFGLAFTVLGIYAVLTSMLLELTAVTFLNMQKKIDKSKLYTAFTVISYIIMIAGAFIVGMGIIHKMK